MATDTKLAIIIPCFNLQENIKDLSEKLLESISNLVKKNKISENSFIYFVDNCSNDESWFEIAKAVARHPNKIKAIKYSKYFGYEKAQLGGIINANKIGFDVAILTHLSIKENELEDFLNKNNDGNKIVFGINNSKKMPNSYLISKEIANILEQYKDNNISLKHILNNIGYRKAKISISSFMQLKDKKIHNIFSMLNLVSFIGKLFIFLAIALSVYISVVKSAINSLFGIMLLKFTFAFLFFGILILCISIVGKYLDKKLDEIRKCPQYIIEEELL